MGHPPGGVHSQIPGSEASEEIPIRARTGIAGFAAPNRKTREDGVLQRGGRIHPYRIRGQSSRPGQTGKNRRYYTPDMAGQGPAARHREGKDRRNAAKLDDIPQSDNRIVHRPYQGGRRKAREDPHGKGRNNTTAGNNRECTTPRAGKPHQRHTPADGKNYDGQRPDPNVPTYSRPAAQSILFASWRQGQPHIPAADALT